MWLVHFTRATRLHTLFFCAKLQYYRNTSISCKNNLNKNLTWNFGNSSSWTLFIFRQFYSWFFRWKWWMKKFTEFSLAFNIFHLHSKQEDLAKLFQVLMWNLCVLMKNVWRCLSRTDDLPGRFRRKRNTFNITLYL